MKNDKEQTINKKKLLSKFTDKLFPAYADPATVLAFQEHCLYAMDSIFYNVQWTILDYLVHRIPQNINNHTILSCRQCQIIGSGQ